MLFEMYAVNLSVDLAYQNFTSPLNWLHCRESMAMYKVALGLHI